MVSMNKRISSPTGLLFSSFCWQTPVNKHRWFNWTEYALLVGSGAGTIASVATQQVLLAAAPLSLLAGLGLLSRRQLQEKLDQDQSVMLSVNSSLDKRLRDMQEQVEDLPSHEQLNAIRQSVTAQNQQDILSLSQLFEYTRNMLLEKIEDQDIPELQELRQELSTLQKYCKSAGVDLRDIKARYQQLADTSRIETVESMVAKLKAELMQFQVHMEVFGSETKQDISSLDSKLQALKQQLPTDKSQLTIQEDLQKLVKAVSELVPRDEFMALSAHLQRELTAHASSQMIPSLMPEQKPFTQLQQRVDTLEQQLDTVTDSVLEAVAETLEPFQKGKGTVFQHLQQRLDETDEQMNVLTDAVLAAVDETLEPIQASVSNIVDSQWLFDFDNVVGKSNSRKALEQLLAQATERVVLVWPWADNVRLDADLLQQLRQVLDRNCRLDIGWCHQGDNREQVLLRTISQRWSEDSIRHRQLKHALNQLLPLKQDYPELFSFKILGTTENFAVCDSTSALIGMQALSTQTSLFPKVKLKLRTTDPAVIQPLMQRFENLVIDADDAGAYFNRGITRYDMRDCSGAIEDFTQVIKIRPSAVSYNCRGVAWMEVNDYARALKDFGQAIRLNSELFSARCNRGVLRIDIRDYDGALDDLAVAASLCPQSAIPYFYQGRIFQFLGESQQAVGQFGLAIERQPKLALAYCYRGVVYQKQGKLLQAIADLETAARLLRTTGDVNNLTQVTRKLDKLKQALQVKTAVMM